MIGGEFSSGYCFEKLFDAKRPCSGVSLRESEGEKQNCEQPRMEIPVRYANNSKMKPKAALAKKFVRKFNTNDTSLELLDTIGTEPFNTGTALPGKFTKPPRKEYHF